MSLFVLDTDHLTLYRHGQPSVVRRVESVPADQLAITLIPVEEQLAGWYAQLRQARTAEKLTRAYAGLFAVAEMIQRIRVLPFEAPAVQRYLELRKQFPRQGKLDLAIAAIVLHCHGTLVRRNRRDFVQIPELLLDNWSVEPAGENQGPGEVTSGEKPGA
jgi:tRNA(fMet)-specific endonuclease VapC